MRVTAREHGELPNLAFDSQPRYVNQVTPAPPRPVALCYTAGLDRNAALVTDRGQ